MPLGGVFPESFPPFRFNGTSHLGRFARFGHTKSRCYLPEAQGEGGGGGGRPLPSSLPHSKNGTINLSLPLKNGTINLTNWIFQGHSPPPVHFSGAPLRGAATAGPATQVSQGLGRRSPEKTLLGRLSLASLHCLSP